jgi:hypothetical protein
MIKRCKKGQFYLITVVVLASLFIAFASTYNFLGREKGMNIYETKKEMEIETQKTMEYITYNQLSDARAREVLSNFSDIYINKVGENKNSFFIYGTSANLFIKGFKASDENITVSINSGTYENLNLNVGEYFEPREYNNVDTLNIKVGEVENSFNIKQGQSLYYLIHYKEVGGEYIVVHN